MCLAVPMKITTIDVFQCTCEAKGIERFVAYEIPLDLAKARYGGHFITVVNDLHETDDLRVLDYNGERAFALFRFDELGSPVFYEPKAAAA
jgi:hydrogenase maturation factor